MRKREVRQQAIRKIVRGERVRTQRDLVDRLVAEGFPCTQATVSRDITDMGLAKMPEGVYVLPEDLHLRRLFDELVTDVVVARNLVVVKAGTGAAQGVAAALDAAGLEGVVGSIAGDDTILLIAADDEGADLIVRNLERYRA